MPTALVVALTTWAFLSCFFSAHAQTVIGAGATLPAPLYTKWADAALAVVGVKVNYQAIGSGGGQNQIRAGIVDFGASDEPLTVEELQASQLFQFPTVIGAVVPVVNLPGVVAAGDLRLNAEVLGNIFLGRVTKWTDPAILALNPALQLPALDISLVYRADASGTTYVFTSYLARKSMDWDREVGTGKSVDWPTGSGARGNDGVAATVRATPGAIGYVERQYAGQRGLAAIGLENKNGRVVKPDTSSLMAAAAQVDWERSKDFVIDMIDLPGDDSWPMISPTFVLLPRTPKDKAKLQGVLKFFDWAFRNGDEIASSLGYLPFPDVVEERIRLAWAAAIKGLDGQPLWP